MPGVVDWQKAAATLDPPDAFTWHVFISHAGTDADKPFARALKVLLMRTGWGLRVFLDDDLQPAGDPQGDMDAALKSASVGLLLFSEEFFVRDACIAELRALMDRKAKNRVQLLPVFLRMSVKDCKQRVAAVLGTSGGACAMQ